MSLANVGTIGIQENAKLVKIETERLAIRNFRAGDWKALREMILQKESSEYAAYDHEWPTTEKEVKEITEWFASGNNYLAVCLKGKDQLIGFISLNRARRAEDREFDLGYCFNFNYHGKGYATEGCRAVLDYAFQELKAERVTSGTAAANYPSLNLLRRLGMRKTGESIGSFRKTPDGKPIEFVGFAFAISRDEWLNAQH